MFGNMYPNGVSTDNGPYFVLLRDLTVKYDRYLKPENSNLRECVKIFKTRKNQFYPSCVGVKLIFSSRMVIMHGF